MYGKCRSLYININPLATRPLTLFAFLDPRDTWYDLIEDIGDNEHPFRIRESAGKYHFRNCAVILCNRSSVEAKLNGHNECIYESHPAIHRFARWKGEIKETTYVRCALSMVADKVPRVTDHKVLQTAQRPEPHADGGYRKQPRAHSSCQVALRPRNTSFRRVKRMDAETSNQGPSYCREHLIQQKSKSCYAFRVESRLTMSQKCTCSLFSIFQ